MTTVTLDAIVTAMNRAGVRAYVERLGGNVYGVVDYSGWTVTIDGGVRTAYAEEGPVVMEVCRDGAEVLSTGIHSPGEVVTVLSTTDWGTPT